jgi:tetratricopeptide (TPR) repeat protein
MSAFRGQSRFRHAMGVVVTASLWAFPHLSLAQSSEIGTAAATTVGAAPSKRTDAHRVFVKAMADFIETRDRAKAEREFSEVTQINPSYAPAWFNLGVFAELDRNWSEAERCFNAYLQIAPNGTDAIRAKEQLKLIFDYAHAKVDPATAKQMEYDAAIQRSRSFLAVNLFREAIAEAGRAQAQDPARWEAYALVSICMRRQHKITQAAHFQTLAVNHAPPEKRAQIRNALLQADGVATH